MNESYKFSETKKSVQYPELSQNEIITINKLGLTLDDLHKLLAGPYFAEGSYALIFELPNNEQKTIAKAWKNPDNDSKRAEHENVALRLLRMRNFKEAPRMMGYLKSATILFEEKIEGDPIEKFDENTINQLAATLAKIHSIELNAYGKPLAQRKKGSHMDFFNDEIEKLRQNSSLLSDPSDMISSIRQAINKTKNEAEKEPNAFQNNNFTLIHFDLNCNNILRSKNSDKIILIDWEQASAGDNAMDIAKLFLKLNFDEEQKKCFFSEYEKKLAKEDKFLFNRIKAYEPLVLINSILWRLRVLRDEPQQTLTENEKQFYNRIRNNLDREILILQNFIKNT